MGCNSWKRSHYNYYSNSSRYSQMGCNSMSTMGCCMRSSSRMGCCMRSSRRMGCCMRSNRSMGCCMRSSRRMGCCMKSSRRMGCNSYCMNTMGCRRSSSRSRMGCNSCCMNRLDRQQQSIQNRMLCFQLRIAHSRNQFRLGRMTRQAQVLHHLEKRKSPRKGFGGICCCRLRLGPLAW